MKNNGKIINKCPNWGRIKGGLNSSGSTKEILKPEYSEELAEFIGIILGDGNIHSYKKGKKIGVYSVKIAGDLKKDHDYHVTFIKPLGEKLFGLKAGIQEISKHNEIFTCFYSRELIKYLESHGLKSGDKIKNQITIPKWIFLKDDYLRACIRGLIDTDGSIFRMSKRDKNLLRIGFTNHNKKLLADTHMAIMQLGFNPSRIIKNRAFVISRKADVRKYINEIGFSNEKHRRRLQNFIAP
jgi:intein/homing endonuclease